MSTPVEFVLPSVNIEEKLFQNRYKVDAGRPHITVRDTDVCQSCDAKPCTVCCPAGCWSLDDGGKIDLVVDGCLECGTCRFACGDTIIKKWENPQPTMGVEYRFG